MSATFTVPAESLAQPGRVNVLIVDDNATKRAALKAILLPLGHLLVEADSGVAALRCLLQRNFAVILLDVRMPVMDGLETAALIRQRRQSEMTPIIFITAYGRDEITNVDGYAEGAVDFMFAPIPPNDLRSKVTVFAKLFLKAEALATQSRDVQASADELARLTDSAPVGIFQTDADERYVYTNERWTEITGISAESAFGAAWSSIAPTHLPETPLRADDKEERSRFQIVRPDAELRTVVLTRRPISDARGGWSGSVGTLADVTAEAAAAETLSQAHEAALAAGVMQRNFTASASHELRTPTAAILGFVEEVLESQELSEENRGFLNIVLRNAQRLTRLIDDLLILGQAEISSAMMQVEPTEVRPLVDRVTNDFAASAQAKSISLIVLPAGAGLVALADPLRLEQALTNLISNAIKFTPVGGEVSTRISTAEDAVSITVTDSGVGIDAHDLKRIFERFFRSQTAVEIAVKGSGLGLAITKSMVEAQNGTIAASSEPGKGSVFTITLPMVAS